MEIEKIKKEVQDLREIILITGMEWEVSQAPMDAERILSDLISKLSDKADKILSLLDEEQK